MSIAVESKFISEVRASLQLAVPLSALNLSDAAIGFVDTAMMGLLGSQILAAGALGAITFQTLIFISTGCVEGVTPLIAEALGAGETDRISRVAAQGLWLTAALSLPMMLLIWHLDSILSLLGQEESTVLLAKTYLRAIVWGFPAAIGFAVLKEIATALNQPKFVTAIAFAGPFLNAGANYVLIFGKFGFPALGLAGIGWASTLTFWVNFILAAGIVGFHVQFRDYQLVRHLHQFNKNLFVEVFQIGLPISLQLAAEFGLLTFAALLMGRLGTTMLAANQIVVQTIDVVMMVSVGVGYAATARVGQLKGAKDLEGAKRAGLVALVIGAVGTGIIALAWWLFPEQIVAIYLDANDPGNVEALEAAISLLKVAAVFQLAYGLNLIAFSVLLGLKESGVSALINILAFWGIGAGGGYLLGFPLQKGGIGLWWGLTAGMVVATVLLIWRFYQVTTNPIDSTQDEEERSPSTTTRQVG